MLSVKSAQEMPFHGPSGPGTEPMSISFRWIVVLVASAGSGASMGAIHTTLQDSLSSNTLVAATASTGLFLAPGVPREVSQGASGFFNSAQYPGDWHATVSATVVYPSGRSETLLATFAFR